MRVIILISLLIGLLQAETRHALLIGNYNYKHIDDLQNPLKNINRLKESLEKLDFRVKVEEDLNSEYLAESIEQFAKQLSQNKNNIGFLYYSGHGCQLDYKGYLVPTDVDTKNRVKIKHRALSINEMLDTLEMANNQVNLLFLDACRDVPTGTKGGTKGLGQPTATPKGSLVVYATEAGKTAEDNSNFINALIENIKQPNEDIKDIADNVSNAVADKTGEKQIPVVFYKRLPEVILLKNTDSNKIELSNENISSIIKKLCPSNIKDRLNSTCYSLRVGDKVFFPKFFTNNRLTDIKFYDSNITFSPEGGYKYSGQENPLFKWGLYLPKYKGILGAKKRALILQTEHPYTITYRPKERSFNNLKIQYTLKYQDIKNNEAIGKIYKNESNHYYEITWCGDGILDAEYGEKCDFRDKQKTNFGNMGCTLTCLPISRK